MREILFRGKRLDTDEWVYGVPLFEEIRCYMIEDLFICDEYQCTEAVNSIVDPETVGQYTGLTDNNGKKIFEGDIVKAEQWYNCGCYPHSEIRTFEVKIPDIYQIDIASIEIVGNDYDRGVEFG